MSQQVVLVLNAGSSSLKYQVVELPSGQRLAGGNVERIERGHVAAAFDEVTRGLTEAGLTDRLTAVGHRVVHGGPRHTALERVDDELIESVEELAKQAPLHNPPAAEGMRRARAAHPEIPQFAIFDTAFFADLPAVAATYAIDRDVARAHEIRRYGMHGTSHQYVAGRVAEILGRDLDQVDQIVLHLGNGASAAAVRGGRAIETSMGLTPLEGLVMGTRAGDLDPGILLHLQRHASYDVDQLDDLLNHRSGLSGLADVSDFRDLAAAVESGDRAAALAHDVYCYRIRKYVGAYLAVLGGADALTFTGGVGEHVARVREHSLRGLERLGIAVDPGLNRARDTHARVISTPDSTVTVLVVPTDEELAIARDVARALDADGSGPAPERL